TASETTITGTTTAGTTITGTTATGTTAAETTIKIIIDKKEIEVKVKSEDVDILLKTISAFSIQNI
ncbi:MAG: hypothetical protein WCG82_11645, partial [Bacteroidota bacterium]